MSALYYVGRFLQIVGLLIVPMALFYGIEGGGQRGVAMNELLFMAFGACVFLIGRMVEAKGRS